MFTKHASTRDGLRVSCRECLNKYRLEWKRNKRAPRPDEKRCGTCGKIKPRSEFAQSKARSDGIQSVCKPCRAGYAKKWRAKRKKPKRTPDPRWTWDRQFNLDRLGPEWDGLCWHGRFTDNPCRKRATHESEGDSQWQSCTEHTGLGCVPIAARKKNDSIDSWIA